MSDPKPLSDFVQACQQILDQMRETEDTSIKEMLRQQLLALLDPKRRRERE